MPVDESEPVAKKPKREEVPDTPSKLSDFLPKGPEQGSEPLELPAFAAHTDPGSRYGSLNQDCYFMERLKQPNGHHIFVIGVFDGHGKHGEKASKLASDHFQSQLGSHLLQPKHASTRDHEKALRNIFEGAHKRILAEYETLTTLDYDGYKFNLMVTADRVDFYASPDCPYVLLQDFGTTAVVCIYWEETQKLMVANCGDSDALIGRWDGTTKQIQPTLLAINDNVCCTTNGEQERIKRDFGRKAKFGGGYLSPNDETYGFHSLAMTRALGHKFLEKYGVTWDPHIRSFQITPEDIVLVVASDGLFDVVNTKAVLSVAAERHLVQGTLRTLTPHESSERLVKLALGNWKRQFSSVDVADNTTVCVIKLSSQFDQEVPQRDELSNSGTAFSPALTIFHAIEAEREETSKDILSHPSNPQDASSDGSSEETSSTPSLPSEASSMAVDPHSHQASLSSSSNEPTTLDSSNQGSTTADEIISPPLPTAAAAGPSLPPPSITVTSETGTKDASNGPNHGKNENTQSSTPIASDAENQTIRQDSDSTSQRKILPMAVPVTSSASNEPGHPNFGTALVATNEAIVPITQAQSPMASNFSTTPSETPPIVPHNTPLESDSSTTSSGSVSQAITPPNGSLNHS